MATTTPADRTAKKKTNAQLLAEIEELKAAQAGVTHVTGADGEVDEEEDYSIPLSLSLAVVETGTLVNKDPHTGVQIHMREVTYSGTKELSRLQYKMSAISRKLDAAKSDEAQATALDELMETTEKLGALLFDEDNDALAQRYGVRGYQQIVSRAVIKALKTTTASTGN